MKLMTSTSRYKKNKITKGINITLASAAISTLLFASSGFAQSAEDDTEIIQVSGIRGSLQKSVALKRSLNVVADVISAEDMGKFPDQNLAESLQRISGVSISRVRGEGSRVSVRGLGTGFNFTTLNGNGATSASSDVNGNGGRDFAFDVLPAELVAGIEVYKSPMADLNEGSLGALINIKTAHPFDRSGLNVSATIENSYSDLSGANDPKGSFFISNTNEEETFGALLSLSYSSREIRQDSFITNGYSAATDELTTALGLTAGVDNPFVATNAAWGTLENERKRLGVGGSLQFRPSDNVELTYDVFYSKLEETGNAASINMQPIRAGADASGVVTNGVVTSLSADSLAGPRRILVTNGNDNFVFPGENEFQNHSFEASWDINSDWVINAKAYYTKSESIYEFERYFANFTSVAGAFTYDQSEIGEVPDLSFPGVDFSDESIYEISNLLGVDVVGEEDESGFQLDVDKYVGGDFIESIEFGAQKKDRERFQDRDLFFEGTANAPYPNNVANLAFPSNFFSDSSSVFPRDLVYGGVDETVAALGGADGIDFSSNFDAFLYTVKEDVSVAYAKLNFAHSLSDVPVTGNIGVRYVKTDQTSSGISQVLLGVDPENPDLPLFSDEELPISESNDYSNLLWSFNLKADLTDDIVARFSAANVISRPPVSRLAPTLTSINVNNGTLGKGNSQLKPYEADQLDLTLEWYFDELGALTAGLFWKDLSTLVSIQGELEEVVPDLFLTVTQPRNTEGTSIKGLELSYQQQFSFLPGWASGLGLIANYTYIDDGSTFENAFVPEGIGLVGASEHNYNIVAFYEENRFSARLGYNYRSDFLEREVGLAGNPEYVDGYGQLDGQVSYEVNDNFSVYVDATDITGETLFRYSNNDVSQIRALTRTGARYSIGLRAKF